MNTTSASAASPNLPPIQSNLVDSLMHQANTEQQPVEFEEIQDEILPDFTVHTARIVLVLSWLCLMVPIMKLIAG